MNVGIDIGYRATKVVWKNGEGLNRHMFLSIVGTPDRPRFGLGEDQDVIIETEHGIALVGQGAVEQSRFQERREDRDWLQSHVYRFLLATALTEVTTATTVDLDIVTGLPVAFYGDREKQREVFIGEHVVRRDGRNQQRFHVRSVRIIPQPFGTLFSEGMSDSGQFVAEDLSGRVGIIDVGGKTTNLVSVLRVREVAPETAGVNVGGWDITRRVNDWLDRRCSGLDLTDHEIAEAIVARKVRYYGEDVDLSGIVANVADNLLRQIVGEASELWNGGAKLDRILITGGGALLIGQELCAHFPQAIVVSDPVFANALGYWKLSQRE